MSAGNLLDSFVFFLLALQEVAGKCRVNLTSFVQFSPVRSWKKERGQDSTVQGAAYGCGRGVLAIHSVSLSRSNHHLKSAIMLTQSQGYCRTSTVGFGIVLAVLVSLLQAPVCGSTSGEPLNLDSYRQCIGAGKQPLCSSNLCAQAIANVRLQDKAPSDASNLDTYQLPITR